jgi:hypothetical protein
MRYLLPGLIFVASCSGSVIVVNGDDATAPATDTSRAGDTADSSHVDSPVADTSSPYYYPLPGAIPNTSQKLDLLFVVGNSLAMADQQSELAK